MYSTTDGPTMQRTLAVPGNCRGVTAPVQQPFMRT